MERGHSLGKPGVVIPVLVVVHLAVTVWHGLAHEALGIDLPPAKDLFVYVVILGLPIAAAVLVQRPHWQAALSLYLFIAAMLASFVFAGYHHYVMISPDHIAHLPAGSEAEHAAFLSSAAAMGVVDPILATVGAYLLGRGTAP